MTNTTAQTHAGTSCGSTSVESFLAEAEKLVMAKGQKLTKIRRKILTLLVESPAPAKAYDLLTQLDGEGAAKPPTVYRALDFLQEYGLAHKIESLNAYVACGHASHTHSAIFLICEICHGAEELHATKTARGLEEDCASIGFVSQHSIIEVRGTCRNCAS